MKIKKHFISFWQRLFHIRVAIFIFIGAGIIFLTFFTSNNAVEIAISGVASVFIGIAVNNFSMLETHEKDAREFKAKMLHFFNALRLIEARISKLEAEAGGMPVEKLKQELSVLAQLVSFTILLMSDDDPVN